MSHRKKIGIITLYSFAQVNYGNKYQNYACEKIYENLGYEVETLVKEKPLPHFSFIKYRMYRFLNFITGYHLSSKQNLWKRYISFQEFENRFLHIRYIQSKKITDTNYDFYSIGSDQVWNPNWTYRPDDMRWYFCSDVPEEKRICLSPSFGVDAIPNNQKERYAGQLKSFRYISVREDAGKEIVKELTGKYAEVLIDPTLALSKDEWNTIQKKPRFVNRNERYVLCYFLGGISDQRRSLFQQYADHNRLKLFDMMDEQSKFYSIGPSEFMWMLGNAEAIFTDSFHGSVFSIIYEKPLFVFRREGINNDMFSRLDTLLRKFHLEDRIVEASSELEKMQACNYAEAQGILKIEQEKLWKFLEKSLKKG